MTKDVRIMHIITKKPGEKLLVFFISSFIKSPKIILKNIKSLEKAPDFNRT